MFFSLFCYSVNPRLKMILYAFVGIAETGIRRAVACCQNSRKVDATNWKAAENFARSVLVTRYP